VTSGDNASRFLLHRAETANHLLAELRGAPGRHPRLEGGPSRNYSPQHRRPCSSWRVPRSRDRPASSHAVSHVVGIVQEFPSAPPRLVHGHDLDYLLSVTHDPGPNVRPSPRPTVTRPRVAKTWSARSHGPAGASVKDITTTDRARRWSSITTVDMSGIAKIEEAFRGCFFARRRDGALRRSRACRARKHEFATDGRRSAAPCVRSGAFSVERGWRSFSRGGLALAALLGLAAGGDARRGCSSTCFDPPPDHLACAVGSFSWALAVAGRARGALADDPFAAGPASAAPAARRRSCASSEHVSLTGPE